MQGSVWGFRICRARTDPARQVPPLLGVDGDDTLHVAYATKVGAGGTAASAPPRRCDTFEDWSESCELCIFYYRTGIPPCFSTATSNKAFS